jgi:hypothetical protein
VRWNGCADPLGLAYLAREHRLSVLHSTVLIVRVTSLMIGLHIAQILVWAYFIAGCVFPLGDSPSTSRLAAILRSATVILFSRQRGGAWALPKR